MTAANEQQMTHADRHDLDKLSRWRAELESAADNEETRFPACAIFLVSPDDLASHDIFRRYRSTFEELGSGFHNLVIFGQHGVSTAQAAFLGEVEREQASVPLLVIAPMADNGKGNGGIYCLELPKGERNGELDDSQGWGEALERIRAAASGQAFLSLDGVTGVIVAALRHGTLSGAAGGVLQGLSGEA